MRNCESCGNKTRDSVGWWCEALCFYTYPEQKFMGARCKSYIPMTPEQEEEYDRQKKELLQLLFKAFRYERLVLSSDGKIRFPGFRSDGR